MNRLRENKAILLIAIFMISAIAVIAPIPTVSAQDPVPAVKLQTQGDGTAEWTTDQVHTGSYSVELSTGPGTAGDDWAMVLVPIGDKTLSGVASVSYGAKVVQTAEPLKRYRPWVGIYLDDPVGGDGDPTTYEYYIQAEPMYAYPNGAFGGALDTWEKWDSQDAEHPLRWMAYEVSPEFSSPDLPYEAPLLEDYISGDAVTYETLAHETQEFASREYGSLTVIKIKFMAGYGTNWETFIGYVDDIKINDITYNLELPSDRPLTVDDDRVQNPEAYFQNIQSAIDCATTGDTILVYPGTYTKYSRSSSPLLQIDKALTVKSTDGAEKTIIKGFDDYDAQLVRIYHSDVTFEGFTVTDPTYGLQLYQSCPESADAAGILVGAYSGGSVNNVYILNNIVTQVRSETGTPSDYGATGINIGTGPLSNIVISGNTITDIKNPSIYTTSCEADHTCGINVWGLGATNVVISNNSISDIKFNGIILERASDVLIENNTITGCEAGIRVEPFEGATVSGLTINLNTLEENGKQLVDQQGDLNISEILANNIFDRAVVIDRPAASLLHVIYSFIQDAIDTAISGDTILVNPGTYEEDVNITKSLQLLGAKAGIPAGPDANPAGRGALGEESIIKGTITESKKVSGSTIDGFTILSNGKPGIKLTTLTARVGDVIKNNIIDGGPENIVKDGISSATGGGYLITNNNIRNYFRGMMFDGGATDPNCTISGNYITNASFAGIVAMASWSNGHNIFSNNLIENNEAGIHLAQSSTLIGNDILNSVNEGIYLLGAVSGTWITNNTVSGSGTAGISIQSATGPITISPENIIYNNAHGIQVVDSSDITILGNQIYNNTAGPDTAGPDTGISISGSYNVTVAGNDIYNNTGGIGIADSSTLITVGPENNIYNNVMYGVQVQNCNPGGSADAVTIWGNNIYDNTEGYNQTIGIFVSNSGYVNASSNNLWGGAFGILNWGSSYTIYSDNIIHDMVNATMDGGSGSAGIAVLGGPDVTISGNEIYNIDLAGVAIMASQSIDIVDGNDIYGNGIGVMVGGFGMGPSSDISITGNSIYNNHEGIVTDNSQSIMITENEILNNTGVGSGISVSGTGSTNIQVHHNNIVGNVPYGVAAYEFEISQESVHASENYWGNITGPGGVASGSGDAVTENVEYQPWLTRTFQTVYENLIQYFGWEHGLAKGWDIFSTPISLEGKTFYGGIVNEEDIIIAYKFNSTAQKWDPIETGDTLQPLEAVYVRSNTDTVARITLNPTQTSPPMRQLHTSWNLIGPAPQDWMSMPVDQALVSVEQTAGGLRGYTIVVSPPINQNSWTYIVGAASPSNVEPYQGYWVFMENDDMLAGFSSTPLIWGPG